MTRINLLFAINWQYDRTENGCKLDSYSLYQSYFTIKIKSDEIRNSTLNGFSVPRKLMDVFSIFLNTMIIIMVPLTFPINYYFFGQWEKIWNHIQKIDREIVASRNVYKQCRYRCIFSILLFAFPFLLVRVSK